MRVRYWLFILTIFLVGSSFNKVAAEPDRNIDRTHLEDYRNLDKYNYDRVQKQTERSAFLNFIIGVIAFFAKGIGLIILIVLVGGLLFLIFYFISKSNKVGTINEDEFGEIQIEEVDDLQSLNLEALLTEALNAKNYRLATRLMYLKILKALNDKKIIEWKNEKTNYDYIREVQDYKLRENLDQVTYLYEYIWYGELPLDEYKFSGVEPKFVALEKNIVKL